MKENSVKMFYVLFFFVYETVAEPLNKCVIRQNSAKTYDDNTCMSHKYCNKTFTVGYVQVPPYSTLFSFEKDLLNVCCGRCASVSNNVTLPRHHAALRKLLNPTDKSSPDFVFPVLDKRSTTITIYGYYFIPLVHLPYMLLITPLGVNAFQRAIKSCLKLYPLLIICILMSFIFGFFIWLVETRHVDGEEYPVTFPLGWLLAVRWSGFSFISQGLESPLKSRVGQLLSVVWLVVAVVMIALLTGVITAEMVEPVPQPTMDNKRVATLSGQPYSNLLILKAGGHPMTFPNTNIRYEFQTIMKHYLNKSIDAILIDKYTMSHVLNSLINYQGIGRRDIIVANIWNNIWTDIKVDKEYHYGIISKNVSDYTYFHEAITSNSLQFEERFVRYWNNVSEAERKHNKIVEKATRRPMFSIDEPYIVDGLIYLSVVIAVIFIGGMFYELRRRGYKDIGKKTSSVEER